MTLHGAQQGAGYFDPLAVSKYVSLTTHKRDGTPVVTTVNVVVEGDIAYFRTWDTSGKAKRIRHTPRVELQPSDHRGKPKGSTKLAARAILLDGDESEKAARALARQHRVVHGIVVPRLHRLRGRTTQQYRLDLPHESPSNGSRDLA